jgi:sulfur carrier protein
VDVTVNGELRSVAPGASVAHVIAELTGADGPPARGLAVAVNGAVVPRSSWEVTALGDGDAVEVLTAVQGG